MSVLERISSALKLDERPAIRRALRRQKEEGKLIAPRLEAKRSASAICDRDADAAAIMHSEICEPIQTELATLEETIISAATDRQPIPAGVEDRRRDLLALLEDQNQILTTTIAAINERRARLNKEVRELGSELAQYAIVENKLLSEAVADPALWLANYAQNEIAGAMVSLARAAQSYIDRAETHAAESDGLNELAAAQTFRARVAKWVATRDAAHAARDVAESRSAELRAGMLNG